MKKILFLSVLVFAFVLSASFVFAAKPTTTGFDQFGYNNGARLFNGWYGYYDKSIDGGWVLGTGDAQLVMKWSKDWTPMADEPIGAWDTNHWVWYSNDYEEGSWYGFNSRVSWSDTSVTPDADYRIEEFLKIQKVSDNAEEWARYEAGGAYDAAWGTYSSGVPKYVVFQDVVDVYGKSWNVTGNWLLNFAGGTANREFRNLVQDSEGNVTGEFWWLHSGVWEYGGTLVGAVSGDSLHLDYDRSPIPYTGVFDGTIGEDGITNGTFSDSNGNNLFWSTSAGSAVWSWEKIESFNLTTTPSKGLGKPIF